MGDNTQVHRIEQMEFGSEAAKILARNLMRLIQW